VKAIRINIFVLVIILISSGSFYSQGLKFKDVNTHKNTSVITLNNNLQQDTTKKETKTNKVSISGLFLSVGGGLSIPLSQFSSTSNAKFGILGRLEFSSTTIFPVVIGGEISYFSYSGADNYMTQYLLNSFQTKILSAGLTLDVTLSQLLKSHYTIPFICLDIKSNNINRVITGLSTLPAVPVKESRISVGAGFGFTLFVLDFYLKYNYMKNLPNIGIYTKVRFPVLRF
jgi:hypothetical protein